jgi:hypothetical protein
VVMMTAVAVVITELTALVIMALALVMMMW